MFSQEGPQLFCEQIKVMEDVAHNPQQPLVENIREIRIGRTLDLAETYTKEVPERAVYFSNAVENLLKEAKKFAQQDPNCSIENCIADCKGKIVPPAYKELDQNGECNYPPEYIPELNTYIGWDKCLDTDQTETYGKPCDSGKCPEGIAPCCVRFQYTDCKVGESQCRLGNPHPYPFQDSTSACDLNTVFNRRVSIDYVSRQSQESVQALLLPIKEFFLPRYLPLIFYERQYDVRDINGLWGRYPGAPYMDTIRNEVEPALYSYKTGLPEPETMAWVICAHPEIMFAEMRRGGYQCFSGYEYDILKELDRMRRRILGGGKEGIEVEGCWQRTSLLGGEKYLLSCTQVSLIKQPLGSFDCQRDPVTRKCLEPVQPYFKGCYAPNYYCPPDREPCAEDYFCCSVSVE